MSYHNEEGTVLLVEDHVEIINEKTNKMSKTFVTFIVLASLALTIVITYFSGVTITDAVESIDFSNKYPKHYREFYKLIISSDFSPYSYLNDHQLTHAYRTVGHGLDEKGNIVSHEKPFYSISLNFFGNVAKIHNNDRNGNEDSFVLLGHMKGLDKEGNILIAGGAYCEYDKAPNRGKIEILCGEEYEVKSVSKTTPCYTKIIVTHPHQCQHPVKVIDPTDGSGSSKQNK